MNHCNSAVICLNVICFVADANQGPTNYSGTQVNMYGVHPAMVPGLMSGGLNPAAFTGGGITYPDKHKQLGFLTDQMIKVRLTYKCSIAIIS